MAMPAVTEMAYECATSPPVASIPTAPKAAPRTAAPASRRPGMSPNAPDSRRYSTNNSGIPSVPTAISAGAIRTAARITSVASTTARPT